ncbi:MAG: UDP-glucose 4-epimerase GalE [Candidatus Marinimicrobia bacterium]|jgi:UDP-glucose 4-epimerase|nr:UDP-glucose 4-epimerase GalE [Candidatus Neomarinimicrobiota bacterium]MBT3675212.1 UDP-glucose 4-epimerase GalE [Candidatus Neomarinimicrobiota bacterium]MBT3762624.1 UDP-glucose 4-epimerase GalE [Candidatus Neomarinimicrobiota bacterium]MBT4068318.1 UDP-glucose 4-epimerase GalE [Candidatus Neomarinimicrobiota bacterium]MBT4270173.1 UDP-glucose 4-epimerase GalE [Candidatus Neomarinimicrobiota bacterium]
MKILVTGGAGYIGSHVVLDLCEAGYEVVVLDDLSTGNREAVDSRAEFVQGSTLNNDDLNNVLNDVEAVVHLAAFKAAGESMVEPGKYSRNNISGTISLLNAMIDRGVDKFIFSSTAAVYGYPQYLPLDENHSLDPINYYGFTKLEIERILKWYGELKGLKFAALRYFNAAGYDPKGRLKSLEKNPANLLPIVMEVASGVREKMQIFGNDYDTPDGTGVRDYIHVSDLASAHLKAIEYLHENESLTVNLATGESHSVLDVIKLAKEISGQEISYDIVDRRAGDPAKLFAGTTLAFDQLGWKAEYSDLRTLLETTWKVYQK